MKALWAAYNAVHALRNSYKEQEEVLGLPTIETQRLRPAIPELENLIPKVISSTSFLWNWFLTQHKIRALLDGVDQYNMKLCDGRVRMTRKLSDKSGNVLTIRDMVHSDTSILFLAIIHLFFCAMHCDKHPDRLPRFMFIIGGDCFSRGVTLPTLLTSLFLRFMENQESLIQGMNLFHYFL